MIEVIYQAKKGQTSYGESIGIVLLDTFTPFVPGDVGNASTFSFPVRYQTVKNLTIPEIFKQNLSFYEAFKTAAQDLVNEGVRAITGDCGFMICFQRKLAAEMNVPVFTSSLLQLPFMQSIIQPEAKIGVITSNKTAMLDAGVLQHIELPRPENIIIEGLEDLPHFKSAAIIEEGVLDTELLQAEVVQTAEHMVQANPDIRLFLLECSLLAPYSLAVQQAVNLPVFDYITMINYVHSSLFQTTYSGIY